MTEVTAAVRADNLGSGHTECAVDVTLDGSGNAVEISWPSAAGLEFVRGLIERRVAASAGVDAVIWVVFVVLAGSWRLGPLLSEDTELICFTR